jgi:hypothetical protein
MRGTPGPQLDFLCRGALKALQRSPPRAGRFVVDGRMSAHIRDMQRTCHASRRAGPDDKVTRRFAPLRRRRPRRPSRCGWHPVPARPAAPRRLCVTTPRDRRATTPGERSCGADHTCPVWRAPRGPRIVGVVAGTTGMQGLWVGLLTEAATPFFWPWWSACCASVSGEVWVSCPGGGGLDLVLLFG